ncbi:class I SAM-dependent methyltransferase [Sorangium sp. So ce1151]|uniref:class I SAM-dependent methyltransferase n=1 Tax=Sorangium sp. So ce1151 TaxID=3133332 RepID=UPI003F5E6C7C
MDFKVVAGQDTDVTIVAKPAPARFPRTEKVHMSEPLIRDVSDTARWAAWCRGTEGDRADALFHDPLARVLAGERGAAIEATMGGSTVASLVTRTVSFDRLLLERLAEGGIDTILNLAAGLDTRPYRLDLPATLRWIEADLPGLVAYKEEVLASERPRCHVERHPVDLSQPDARRALLADAGEASKGVLVLTEALLLYLEADVVAELARDLAAVPAIRTWLTDLLHPALLPIVLQRWQGLGADAASRPRFAPEGGPAWFEPMGWALRQQLSAREEGERLNRPIGPPPPEAQREAARWMNTYVRLDRT